MVYLIHTFLFLFGLCIGSFLNVIIYRLPKGLSIWKGRSFCPECKKKLLWWELIPLFSFFFLRGKCSKCKVKISPQYPIVELVTGILFLLVIKSFNHEFIISGFQDYMIIGLQLLYYFLIISILIAIFFIDLKYYIIPDSLIVIGGAVSFLYLLIIQYIFSSLQTTNHIKSIFPYYNFIIHNSLFINHLIFAIIGGVFFGLIIFLTKGRGMGMGDMKFAILMGLILGGKLVAALYLAFVLGAIVGIFLILLKKKSLKSKVPFGPFLVGVTLLFMIL
jgi:prepilin signal peptidase PulO-like enzyme (type II secretory pathway)